MPAAGSVHAAAQFGDVSLMQKVLRFATAKPNDYKYSPLGIASSGGQPGVAKLLVENGFDPHAEDRWAVLELLGVAWLGHGNHD